ncbi:MAG: hypothetical protein V2A70_09630 [Candidatus Omnitrophota bacterium]
MPNDWLTFVLIGVQDLFVPVQLAVPGVLLALLVLCSDTSKHVATSFLGYFLLFFVLTNVMCDTGMLLPVLSSDTFLAVGLWFYVIVGVFFIGVAGVLGRHWWLLANERVDTLLKWPWSLRLPLFMAGFVALVLAVSLAVLGTVWPLTMHVAIQGSMAFTAGRLFDSLGALVIYELVRNAGVLVILVVAVLRWRGKVFQLLETQKSMVTIIAAAYYLAVGGALIFFYFFNKG